MKDETSSQRPERVKDVYSRVSDGFSARLDWCEELTRDGIRCPVCKALRPGGIERIEALVVNHVPRQVAIGGLFSLCSGLVMREDIIEVVGLEKLRELCHFRPVVLKSGVPLKGFRYLVEKRPRGCFRGYPEESRIRLCKDCKRLLYWPMPNDRWYLLHAYWDDHDSVAIVDEHLMCTPQYYEQVLVPLKIPKLVGEDYPLVDAPADGLPISYDEMVAEVGRRGWFCE